jgi:tRNA threonylcarbamoyl adenosine modification protein YjeE
VTSPTFTIGHRYEGRLPVAHLDLYRLEDLGSEDPALLEDYLTPAAVAFVEWPEIAEDAPLPDGVEVARTIALRHQGGDRREIEVGPAGSRQ